MPVSGGEHGHLGVALGIALKLLRVIETEVVDIILLDLLSRSFDRCQVEPGLAFPVLRGVLELLRCGRGLPAPACRSSYDNATQRGRPHFRQTEFRSCRHTSNPQEWKRQ